MNKTLSFSLKIPVLFAVILSVIDALWLVLLDVLAWGRSSEYISFHDTWWNFGDWAMYLWNEIHLPIRFFIDPVFFPTVTTHPLSISSSSIFIYQIICIFQSAIIGFILGFLVQIIKKKNA